MDWGEQAETIKEAARASGGEIPPLPFLQNEPEVPIHLALEWSAFHALSNDRPSGFGAGRIPWSSIDRYAARYDLDDPDEFERFRSLVVSMDAAFVAHVEAKTAKPKP